MLCHVTVVGHRCEMNVDECSSGPCSNGGECVDLVDGFKCICPLGYTGAQCQVSKHINIFISFSCRGLLPVKLSVLNALTDER